MPDQKQLIPIYGILMWPFLFLSISKALCCQVDTNINWQNHVGNVANEWPEPSVIGFTPLQKSINDCTAGYQFNVDYQYRSPPKKPHIVGFRILHRGMELFRVEASEFSHFVIDETKLFLFHPCDHNLQAFNMDTGKLVWQTPLPDRSLYFTRPPRAGRPISSMRLSAKDEVDGEEAGETIIFLWAFTQGDGFAAAYDVEDGKCIAISNHTFEFPRIANLRNAETVANRLDDKQAVDKIAAAARSMRISESEFLRLRDRYGERTMNGFRNRIVQNRRSLAAWQSRVDKTEQETDELRRELKRVSK